MSRPQSRPVDPKSPASDFVTCQLCGHAFKAINWPHLVRKHGLDPAHHPILVYKHRFGLRHSWSEATIRKASRSRAVLLERQHRRWTAERVKREIRARQAQGLGLTQKAVGKIRGSLGSLEQEARRFFGGWYEAVAAAGIDPATVRIRVRWNPGSVIARIREEQRSGRDLRYSAVRDRCCALELAARRYFGSWEAALTAAGIDPATVNPLRKWNRQRVIDAVRALERLPTARELVTLDSGLAHAVYRYVGSWKRALQLAVAPIPRP